MLATEIYQMNDNSFSRVYFSLFSGFKRIKNNARWLWWNADYIFKFPKHRYFISVNSSIPYFDPWKKSVQISDFATYVYHHNLNFFDIHRADCNSNKTGCSPLFQGRTLWPLQMLLPDNSSCPRWCRPSPLPFCEPLANTGSCHSSRNIRPIRHDCRWQAQAPPRVEEIKISVGSSE